jgi:hypothetical protein
MLKECRDKDLEPLLEDIYNMIKYSFTNEITNKHNHMKIEFIDTYYDFFKEVVRTNNVELFHKLITEIIKPNTFDNSKCHIVIDSMKILLNPLEYCSSPKKNFSKIVHYYLLENKYELYKENDNYLFFYYLTKIIEAKIDYKDRYIEQYIQLVIYIFLKNNIEPDKFLPTLLYIIKNKKMINEFICHNITRERNNYEIIKEAIIDIAIKSLDSNYTKIK